MKANEDMPVQGCSCEGSGDLHQSAHLFPHMRDEA